MTKWFMVRENIAPIISNITLPKQGAVPYFPILSPDGQGIFHDAFYPYAVMDNNGTPLSSGFKRMKTMYLQYSKVNTVD